MRNQIALTLGPLPSEWARGFLIRGVPDGNPRPLAGEGRVRVCAAHRIFEEAHEGHEGIRKLLFINFGFVLFVTFVVKACPHCIAVRLLQVLDA
jgi:hypothetical protein